MDTVKFSHNGKGEYRRWTFRVFGWYFTIENRPTFHIRVPDSKGEWMTFQTTFKSVDDGTLVSNISLTVADKRGER